MAPKDILDVEWRASKTLGHFHNIRRRHKQKYGARIDEATNEPGTGDPIDFRTGAGHPHGSPEMINGRKLGQGNQWKIRLLPSLKSPFQHLRWNTLVSKPGRNPLA
jgi:hypothetical protein